MIKMTLNRWWVKLLHEKKYSPNAWRNRNQSKSGMINALLLVLVHPKCVVVKESIYLSVWDLMTCNKERPPGDVRNLELPWKNSVINLHNQHLTVDYIKVPREIPWYDE